MKENPPQELVCRYGHLPLLVAVRVILPPEGDLIVLKGDQAMIGDRHAMRVAGQIVEHVIRPPERPFGVDHPVLAKKRSQERVTGLAFREWFEVSSENQLA